MASAHTSKKRSLTWRHALLGTISVVAMAATFSAVGPTKAKANFNCANAGGSNNFNILLPPGQNGRNNGDTVQVCFGNVMLGEDNGNLDGTGGQLDIGLHVGNIYAGLANGSANGNIFFSQIPNSSSISLQVGNLLLGIANGSGNGNIVFGNNPNPYGDDANTVSATNIMLLNSELGIANGSGNGNIVFDQFGNDATNIRALNSDAGILNGSVNGNQIFGTGNATNIALSNNTQGIGNLTANANVVAVGNCQVLDSGAETLKSDTYVPGKGYVRCGETGDANSKLINNTAFGNANGSGNANSFGTGGAELEMVNNRLFGNLNASGNGNGAESQTFGSNGGPIVAYPAADAEISDNFMTGNLNGSGNGNGAVYFEGDCGPDGGDAEVTKDTLDGAQNNLNGGCHAVGGSGHTELTNNFISGTGNVSENGNGWNGNAEANFNETIGEGNLSGNGNADFGREAQADGNAEVNGNFVVGAFSGTNNGNATAYGGSGNAQVIDNTILGNFSGFGNGNGSSGSAHVIHNVIIGDESGSGNFDNVVNNKIIGDRSGSFNGDNFANNTIVGNDSGSGGGTNVNNNYIFGNNAGNGYGNNATNNVAIGTGAGNNVNANNTVAMGTNARAAGNSGIAIGDSSFAAGPNDTALGAGATVTADHSTALGAGANANLPNLVAIGTTNDTYRTPGITSSLSRSRQSGPLEVVTSDANGNLATDNGQIFNELNSAFRRIDENEAGVALALAAVNPDLVDGERFGITANWGGFEGSNAFGMGFEGVLGHNWITQGDRIAVTGGFGVGFVNGDGDDVFGGRVGAQWTWGRNAAAYAVAPVR